MKHKEKYMKFVALLLVVVLGSISFFQYQRRSEKPKEEEKVVASVEEESKTAGSKKKQAEGGEESAAEVVEGESTDSDLEIRKIEPEIDEDSIAVAIEETGLEITLEEVIETFGDLDMEIGSSEENGIEKTIVSTKNTTVVSLNDEENEVIEVYSLDESYTVEEADQVDIAQLEPVLVMDMRVARQPMTGRFDGHSVESIYCDSTATYKRYTYTYGTHALGYGWEEHIVSMGGLTDQQIQTSDGFVQNSKDAEKTAINFWKALFGKIPVIGEIAMLMDAIINISALEGLTAEDWYSYIIGILGKLFPIEVEYSDVYVYLMAAIKTNNDTKDAYNALKGSDNFATYSTYLNPEENATIKPTFIGAVSNPFRGALTGHEGFDYLEFTVPYAANYTLSWSADLSLHVKFCESDRITVLSEDYRTNGTLNQHLEPGTYYISVTPYSDPVAVVQYNLTLMHDSQETWLEYELDPAEDEVAVPLIAYREESGLNNDIYYVCYFKKGSRYIFGCGYSGIGYQEGGHLNAFSSELFRFQRVSIDQRGFRSETNREQTATLQVIAYVDEIRYSGASVATSLNAGRDYAEGIISLEEATMNTIDGSGVKGVMTETNKQRYINIDFEPGARNAVVYLPEGRFVIYSSESFTTRTITRTLSLYTDRYEGTSEDAFGVGTRGYADSGARLYNEVEIDVEIWTDEEAAKRYVLGQ